jgi:hypothetical protein
MKKIIFYRKKIHENKFMFTGKIVLLYMTVKQQPTKIIFVFLIDQ